MKKKPVWGDYVCKHTMFKLILMSKITFLLFFAGLLQVSASGYAQLTRFSLNMTNVPIVEVFEQIEAQSEFRCFYDNSQVELNQKVSVEVTDRRIEDVLDNIFKTPVSPMKF